MTEVLQPADAAQVVETVAWAVSEEVPLEITGAGTKRGLGRPLLGAHGGEGNRIIGHTLDLSRLSGITLYEPEELVLSAGAGTLLAEIEAAVAERGQQLAFEPMHMARLYGNDGGTLGGAIACNLAGPRRIKAGAARDHVLGVKGVSGRGEAFKSGGRVVKNVTGYDLSKLMTGSYGTLAALTEITIKVLPAPEKISTILLFGLDDAAAVRAMTVALNSSHEVSGAAHLPAPTATQSAVGYVSGTGGAVTALRVEGFSPSVAARTEALRDLLGSFGALEELHSTNSALFWQEVRDAAPFQEGENPLWRLSAKPSAGAAVVRDIAAALPGAGFYDWGGGLIWYHLDAYAGDGGAAIIRAALEKHGGGHATLVRAGDDVRARVPVFQPQADGLTALSARVKDSFDPRRVLNPGRMYRGV
ncbi:MAG: glycolate oxidase FAD binding subunit [Alphaproteobacteria bacterium]|jgi:glycolate oxidase FAD binding subunit